MPIESAKRDTILQALGIGMPLNVVADYVELELSVIQEEMRRDRDFRTKVRKAIADCMHARLTALKDLKNWQALAFILESLWPRRFGRKRRQMPKVIVKRAVSAKIDFSVITPEEKRQLDSILAKLHDEQRRLPDQTDRQRAEGGRREGAD
jgi:hypothetical protein